MKIGYHAPLPPAPTGVAAYAQSLLEALRPHSNPVPGASAADVHLYQLGNNQLHAAIHARALGEPGAILLHDANLHHFYLGALTRPEYIEEFVRQYGEWHRGFAAGLWESRGLSASDERYFRYTMLSTVVQNARLTIVHNAAAAAIARRHQPRGETAVLPHLFAPPPPVSAEEVLDLRHRLELPPRAFLFAIFGHLRESKRLRSALRAYRQARSRNPAVRLLIAGQFLSAPFEKSLAEEFAAEGVLRTGHLPEAEWWRYAHAADACINLRYPSCGETSGISIRLMGIGKPLLVTAGSEYDGYPGGSYVPVDPSPAEEAQLAEAMLLLAGHRGYARDIGKLAQEHILTEHAPDRVARLLVSLLKTLR